VSRGPARLLTVLALVLGFLALAGPASAHVGGEAAGSDYDGRIVSGPDLPGVTVRILQFGDELELANDSDTDVLVPGYSDEPYLRIGPDGVWRNANSPATYLNLDRFGGAAMPARADASAEPEWEQVSTEPAYVWHDHRTHWMSEDVLPPQVAEDPTREHLVSEWIVPLQQGDQEAEVAGVLTWSPPPAPWVVWPVLAALVLVAVAAGLVARTPRLLGGLLAVGAAAALWHAGATPEPSATAGSHAGAVVSALMPASAALLCAVLGVRAALRGKGVMTGLLAVVCGWLLLVQGLPDVDVLWSANVASAGPQVAARVAVALLATFGVGLVIGGIAAARRFREADAPAAGRVATA
jgi:hypothetical protein